MLSELINEDVKKSIDAKRQIETVDNSIGHQRPTTLAPAILTTVAAATVDVYPKSVNEGLIDQSIALDEAGTENKQTSRIQTKKGANGIDYEYEYIYYYYDDDEKANGGGGVGKKGTSVSDTAAATVTQSANKSRYTNLDRSGTTTTTAATVPSTNELPSASDPSPQSRGRTTAVTSATADDASAFAGNEERLPINTRFPPRINTPPVDDAAAKKQPNSVKRPSLELVDSHSFNRDEKVNKNSRTFENEFDRASSDAKDGSKKSIVVTTVVPVAVPISLSAAEIPDNSATNNDESTPLDTTTPLMDKVAFDLYAILANANTDGMLTELDEDVMTATGGDASTIATNDMETLGGGDDEDDVEADARTTIVASTTPIAVPTTTTIPSTTTTTTTTTTVKPTTVHATTIAQSDLRKLPFGSGRNRFRFRGAAQSTTESPPEVTSELVHHKSNRFARPLSGYGSRPKATADSSTQAAPASAVETSTTGFTFKGRSKAKIRNRETHARTHPPTPT